jgi:hypothetical protein
MGKKILILVKTYPNLSRKYGELVCTAGIDENGNWFRLHPIPFRIIHDYEKYKKYEYVDVEIEKNPKDRRPESYVVCGDDIRIVENSFISSRNGWYARKERVLNKCTVHNDMNELIKLAHENKISLAVFKPTNLLDIVCEDNLDTNVYNEKAKIIEERNKEMDLFTAKEEQIFKPMPFLDYKFSYRFSDVNGKESTLQITDWEIGQLY